MNEQQRSIIQEWFAECVTAKEVAELYAELRMEIQKQMEFCIREHGQTI